VVVATPVQPSPVRARIVPDVPAKSEVVETEVGTAAPEPTFPSTPCAIAAKPMVPLVVMVPPVKPLLVAMEVTVPELVVVAMTVPFASTARTVPAAVASEVMANLEVVALLVVAFSAVKFWSVVEESAMRLPKLPMVEEAYAAEKEVEDAYGMVVAPVREKNEEVARAVGTPEAPLTLARMELAAIAESPAVPAVYVMPLLKVVVAESNFEKETEVRQPKIEPEAMSQVVFPEA
jgi:hypothetical protein